VDRKNSLEQALDYAGETPSPQKLAGIAFVVALHVAIIYALLNGLGSTVVQVFHAPLQAQIIQEVKPPTIAPPPPPPPVINPPPPYIPPPLIQIAPPPSPPVIASVTTQKPPAPVPVPVQSPVARPAIAKGAGLDSNQGCAAPQYPEEAENMGETGTSVVQFLIGADGSVQQSRVASSSGHTQLDEAALQALGQCRFKPAIGTDGKPQEAWTSISYVWTLN
jgi:periplasmic protein TonB